MKVLLFLALITLSIAQNSCCSKDSLSIIGAGTVSILPDMASFNVQAYSIAKTSAEALRNVNLLIRRLSAVLQGLKVPANDYPTSSVNVNPEYNYESGVQTLSGQRASQSLAITLRSLENPNQIGMIITQLSANDNITIGGLTFDVANKTAAERQARGAAVEDARNKARQYSRLSNRALGPIKSIADENRQSIVPYTTDANFYRLQGKTVAVPYGKVEVSASVKIDWNLA